MAADVPNNLLPHDFLPGESVVWYRRARGGPRGALQPLPATVASVGPSAVVLDVRRRSGGVRRVVVQLVHRIRRAEPRLVIIDDPMTDVARTPAQRELLAQWVRDSDIRPWAYMVKGEFLDTDPAPTTSPA